jgi:hypothetical protein
MKITNLRRLLLACGGTILLFQPASAQENQKVTFDIQGGFTQNVGNTAKRVDLGWNVGAGAGYNFNKHLSALVRFDFMANDINGTTLNNLGFPGGDVHVWTLSLDPVFHVTNKGPADFYVTGGGGLYHYRQEFTAPTIATVVGFDPFFGFFRTGIPATQVLQSYEVYRPGFDVGAGVAFGKKFHGKFFAEARWRRVLFENGHYDMIPVSFGFRF